MLTPRSLHPAGTQPGWCDPWLCLQGQDVTPEQWALRVCSADPLSRRPSLGTPQQTHPLADRRGGLDAPRQRGAVPRLAACCHPSARCCPVPPFCLMSQNAGGIPWLSSPVPMSAVMGSLRHRVTQGWGQHPGSKHSSTSIPPAARWALHHAHSPEQEQDPPMYPSGVTLQGLAPASSLQDQA